MGFEQITTEVADSVLTITLNRPERLNAWTAQMGQEMRAARDEADADDEVRAIIVTGAGRGFCAGADQASGGDTFDARKREAVAGARRDNGGELTLAQFEAYVTKGEIHYYIDLGGGFGGGFGGATGSTSDIATWVASHFKSEAIGGVSVYVLT